MRTKPLAITTAFFAGFAAALALAGGGAVTPSSFEGKSAKDAAASLLTIAETQAGKGSWELIGIGRVYYLSGDKEKAKGIFDRATATGAGISEWRRIAKVYAEAKEYDNAALALEKAVSIKAEDTALAELAAMYNLAGKRDKAEDAFKRSIAKDPSDTWNTIDMAGSYVGVRPHF